MRTAIAPHELLPKGLEVQTLRIETGRVSIGVASATRRSVCPLCGRTSSRVHSRYARTISDLPWHGISVELEVLARRFFCDEPSCERKIFCERLEEVAARARKTVRLEEALLAIALELGGRAGARLALELGIVAARDALLRRIKAAPLPEVGKVRVLGVDDFAFKKGSTYGTILVNLEEHKVVDLLPERSQESLVAWFRSHPVAAGVEVAARDRSNIYREGLAKGAPEATHVVDRWHFLHNLTLTLEEYLLQKRPVLRKAAAPEAAPEEKEDANEFASGPIMPNRPRNHDRKIEEAAKKRHERLVEQWRNIRRLYLAGADLRHICRRLGISARTVYRYKDLTEPPPRPAYKRRASVLDPYVRYLVRRWNEGCHNGKKLYEEQEAYLERLCHADEALADTRRLTQEFSEMVRRLEGEDLDGWLKDAEESDSTAMRSFALGLRKDLDAVRAGLTEEWSNGCVEGFVHKLKLLKRQGYGRAGFELLRARMLAA